MALSAGSSTAHASMDATGCGTGSTGCGTPCGAGSVRCDLCDCLLGVDHGCRVDLSVDHDGLGHDDLDHDSLGHG